MSAQQNAGPTGDYDSLYRSYVALSKRVDQLSMLREIGLAINSTLELSEALPIIASVVQGALDVRRLTIYELGKDGDTIRPIIAKYGDDLISSERLEEDERPIITTSPLGMSLDERRVLVENSESKSDALIPLMTKNTVLGVMHLEDPRDGVPFGPGDESFLHTLGSQIAVAINNAQLYALAVSDGLTKLYVRRYFDLRMTEECDQAQRYNRSFSLIMFDIDHFKKFNDTHGHQTGDMVLQQFAALLKANTRSADICCRYGGEEMAVVLPETGLDEASHLAHKLCDTIRGHAFMGTSNQELAVTASLGVAAYHKDCATPEDIVKACDDAMYRAKENGRDCVELAMA